MKNSGVRKHGWEVAKLACLGICLWAGAAAVSAEPFKFALLGDSRGPKSGQGSTNGVRVAVLGPLAEEIAREHVNMVLFSGDLASGSAKVGPLAEQWAVWKEAMAPIYKAGIPVYPCRGNHETPKAVSAAQAAKEWRAFFPELPTNGPAGQEGLTFSFELANATFIAFDQHAGRSKKFSETNYDDSVNSGIISPWVFDSIKKARTPWVFVFSHEAAWMGHHKDGLVNVPAERDALWDALGARGGIYLAGHDHMYVRRTAPDSQNRPVMELVAGCAGAPPYPYDHAALNGKYDRHVVPKALFINASAKDDSEKEVKDKTSVKVRNTKGYPNYFGYVLITLDGNKLTGQWRALTNFNLKKWELEGKPKFATLDTFTQKAKPVPVVNP